MCPVVLMAKLDLEYSPPIKCYTTKVIKPEHGGLALVLKCLDLQEQPAVLPI
jgi:hypothetical protein